MNNDAGGTERGFAEAALAEFAASLTWETLPDAVKEKAHATLLYGLAVGWVSRNDALPQAFIHSADEDGINDLCSSLFPLGTIGATRLVDGGQVDANNAAFHNAILLHARAQEDAHPAGHVGVVVIPAALAVAQTVGSSGKDLLCAIVAGYEIALRVARDHVLDSSSRGLRSTPLYGVLGAAAAAAKLMGADAKGIQRAMSIAANLGCGLRGFVEAGTEEYVLHAAFAANNGILAAQTARKPIRLADAFLDTPAGFFGAYGRPDTCYSRRVIQDLGADFEFLRIMYKPYPGCQFNRNVIRGVLALREQCADMRPARMEIRMRPFEAEFFGVAFRGPFNSFAQTFMSAPFCAATAWVRGRVEYRDLHTFDDTEVTELAQQIDVMADPDCQAYHPQITIHNSSGDIASWSAEASPHDYVLDWNAAVSMTHSDEQQGALSAKADSLLIEAVRQLAESDSVEALTAVFRQTQESDI